MKYKIDGESNYKSFDENDLDDAKIFLAFIDRYNSETNKAEISDEIIEMIGNKNGIGTKVDVLDNLTKELLKFNSVAEASLWLVENNILVSVTNATRIIAKFSRETKLYKQRYSFETRSQKDILYKLLDDIKSRSISFNATANLFRLNFINLLDDNYAVDITND